jgi:hypothetical protein
MFSGFNGLEIELDLNTFLPGNNEQALEFNQILTKTMVKAGIDNLFWSGRDSFIDMRLLAWNIMTFMILQCDVYRNVCASPDYRTIPFALLLAGILNQLTRYIRSYENKRFSFIAGAEFDRAALLWLTSKKKTLVKYLDTTEESS